MVQMIARSLRAATAKQRPPLDPGTRPAFSLGFGCEVNPHSGAERHRELDESKFSFLYASLRIGCTDRRECLWG